MNTTSQPLRIAPLAFGQQRIWHYSRLLREGAVNVSPIRFNLHGDLNVLALERSFDALVRRHDLLRTNIIVRAGQPVQVIRPAETFNLPTTDLSSQPTPSAEVERIWREEHDAGFRLDTGPWFRVRLLRIKDDEHVLLLTMHHILFDQVSREMLLRELEALYESYCWGMESPLPAPTCQFADYAIWERERLREDGELFQSQLTYWRKQLADLHPIKLTCQKRPVPKPRWWSRLLRGRSVKAVSRPSAEQLPRFVFPPNLINDVGSFSRREGCTLYMALLAALKITLACDSGATDIAVGVYSRPQLPGEFANLLGFFSNFLVLRTNFAGNPTLREALQRVRETTLAAYTHQDLPHEELGRLLQAEGNPVPQCHALFDLQRAARPPLQLMGLRCERARLRRKTHSAILSFSVSAFGEAGAEAHADPQLFEHAGVNQLLRNYEVVLKSMTSHPDQRISEMPGHFKRKDCVHEIRL